MNKILISGGTGLVGKQLRKLLESSGYEVNVLTRSPKKQGEFIWNIDKRTIDKNAFIGVTHIIHLAGAGIADKRWTKKRKQEIIDSRVKSANLLFEYVLKLNIKLKGFISASGIGYYGANKSTKEFSEESLPYKDYIAKVCILWEGAAKQFEKLNIPVTILRTGIVLSNKGGALTKMNTPIFIAALGGGEQYFPWIHINDLCQIYMKCINNKYSVTFNSVANDIQTNNSFSASLAKMTGKMLSPLNVPSFILRILLGEMSVILLYGNKISSEKIASFYQFEYSNLKNALKYIIKKRD